MAYHELEKVELTNMCAIIDEKNQKVLVQERKKIVDRDCISRRTCRKRRSPYPLNNS
ncbi:7,8-dihydro-8-oxoguanine-triphosphatase [Lactococcus cremoris]|nr:7,8-dihydro-8-oxoguanine-triphosphatase [Lactococcus cremoris]